MKRYLFWLLFWSILLSGCSLEKRIIKAKLLAIEHPKYFADFCAAEYPVIPTYIKGKDSIIEKTVEVKGDSIPCPPNEKGEIVKVKCPDAKVVTRDVFRTDTVIKENTAKSASLENKLLDAYKDIAVKEVRLTEALKSRNKYRLYFFILLAITGIGIYAKIRRLI